jgi:hypothetical protein
LALALRKQGLSSISNRLVMACKEIGFPNSTIALMLGGSVGWTTDSNSIMSDLLKGDILVSFPNGTAKQMGPFQPSFLDPLIDPRIDPSELALIPWAQSGGGTVSAGLNPSGDYLQVSFGQPVDGEELSRLMQEGREVVAHYLGRCVAEQLPHEYRGVYGPIELIEDHLPILATDTLRALKRSNELWFSSCNPRRRVG